MLEWMMMGGFILALVLSFWKVYLFLPAKRLSDDDTTPESVLLLEKILDESIQEGMSDEELLEAMKNHSDFDSDHFWRFNLNRLRHLIEAHHLKHSKL